MKEIYNLIGLAHRAGKISSGTMAAKTSLLRKRACLLIMSADISANTREILLASCTKNDIPWLVMGDRYELGTCVGKPYRVAVTINDSGFAAAIQDILEEIGEEANRMGVVEWRK
ncbi:MAG TPA: hypothetical protein GX404_05070 [Syntrophomonadaceae bacterium]|nr:hypothetical protein [Syntrophomonadaceae bacterium]